jgi:prolyl oligopeptidase
MTADQRPGGYPEARRLDLVEDLSGFEVSDPYRWLEDAASPDAQDWLRAQDELFRSRGAHLPGIDRLAGRILELTGTGHIGVPAWRGDRQFFTRRLPGQEHAVLCTVDPGASEARALIDPAAMDPTGKTTLDSWQPDKEGRLLAYQLSEGGSEESVLRVLDVETGELADGPIDRCRYTSIGWLPGGKAFYYTRRLPPEAVPAGEEQYHRRVYLHYLGSPADDDVLIFGDGRDKTTYYSASVSLDGRWLMISAARGTEPRNDLWIADLAGPDLADSGLAGSGLGTPALRPVQEGVDARTGARVGRDGRLYVFTDLDAPRGRLAVTDPGDPGADTWRDLIPADPEAVLEGYAILDGPAVDGTEEGQLLTLWTRHAISEISVHDLATGARTGSVPLPGPGTVGGIGARPEGGHEAWFAYTDNATPAVIMHYDATPGPSAPSVPSAQVWARAPGSVQAPPVHAQQIAYTSADGTVVRMLVISADAAPDRPRPAVLYGYGGFGISLTPAYSPTVLAWVEAGGVYAIAGLRGGSEEGEEWHRAGMLGQRQNVFDDFHAAAEKLIADGWTTREQLGIYGGSNGGLLVGAALTQRPDLYAAVVCSAPLLDMVRYEQFGLGETWNSEYGTATAPEQLGWLLSYSPYHHVTAGTGYPSVLFTVFDNDTRVDPLHARKMCAALQYATSGSLAERPVLLRREADVGHSSRAVSRSVALSADLLAFLAAHTGLPLA